MPKPHKACSGGYRDNEDGTESMTEWLMKY